MIDGLFLPRIVYRKYIRIRINQGLKVWQELLVFYKLERFKNKFYYVLLFLLRLWDQYLFFLINEAKEAQCIKPYGGRNTGKN